MDLVIAALFSFGVSKCSDLFFWSDCMGGFQAQSRGCPPLQEQSDPHICSQMVVSHHPLGLLKIVCCFCGWWIGFVVKSTFLLGFATETLHTRKNILLRHAPALLVRLL